MTDNLKAVWKKISSYSKSDWTIDDYPIRFRQQSIIDDNGITKINFVAQIINWWIISGVGDTKTDAYKNLLNSFNAHKKENELPRPGTKVPLQFASTSQIDSYENIAVDFFDKILALDYYDCFISDETSIYHFDVDEKNIVRHINEVYQIDISKLDGGLLVDIFNEIQQRQK